MFTQTLKSVYFLYGWQPEILIRYALWLGTSTAVTPRILSRHLELQRNVSNAQANVEGYGFRYKFVNSSMYSGCNSNVTVIGMNESTIVSRMDNAEATAGSSLLAEEIQLVCIFTNSLQFFGLFCLATFEMSTSIIR